MRRRPAPFYGCVPSGGTDLQSGRPGTGALRCNRGARIPTESGEGPGEREEFHDRRHEFPVPAVRLQRAPMVALIVQARLVPRASERQPRRAPQFETGPRTESRAAYLRRQCLQPMVYREARKGKLVGAVFD